jgi:hypothetical protein
MKKVNYKIAAVYLGSLFLFLNGSFGSQSPKFKVGDCVGIIEHRVTKFDKVDGSTFVTEKVTAKSVVLSADKKTGDYELRADSGSIFFSMPFDQLEKDSVKVECYK